MLVAAVVVVIVATVALARGEAATIEEAEIAGDDPHTSPSSERWRPPEPHVPADRLFAGPGDAALRRSSAPRR